MKKVLIVEDNEDFLFLLKQGFQKQKMSLVYAMDGQEGLELAEKEKPDLIIIDIDLPMMDGIQMAKKIKEKGLNPAIIFLTNLTDEEHVSKAMEAAGATDYIIKADVHMEDIVARVKEKISLK